MTIMGPGPCPKCGTAMVPLFTSFYCAMCEKTAAKQAAGATSTYTRVADYKVRCPTSYFYHYNGVAYFICKDPAERPSTFKRAKWWPINQLDPLDDTLWSWESEPDLVRRNMKFFHSGGFLGGGWTNKRMNGAVYEL